VASSNLAGQLILTGPAGAASTLTFGNSNSLVDTLAPTTTITTPPSAGVDFSSTASTNVSALTALTASTVLTSVTTAIQDVAYQRGEIGANVNQLTAESNVTSAESVNLTSAQSNVLATNYGAAASDLAKYQVLSQTGISALAQANQVQQEVLKLMQ
jgi:flagellin